eukprot:m51a1_g8429 putative mfs phs inorganic phosphate transporter (619) ;mRNA; f:345400-347388
MEPLSLDDTAVARDRLRQAQLQQFAHEMQVTSEQQQPAELAVDAGVVHVAQPVPGPAEIELDNLDPAERERRRVLRELDERPFGWFHIKTVLVSGIGFFTDAYDLFIINIVVPMIGYAYWSKSQGYDNKVPANDAIFMKGGATIGTFLGQLLFGFLGDTLGRKKIYGVELLIMIVSTICTAMACDTAGGVRITVMLTLWRFALGVGIGGDYPLSAVLTSEYSSKTRRGMMIALVFSMQGIGILFGAIVSLVLLAIFKSQVEHNQLKIDHVWRLCLIIGVLPAACALYFRTRVPESPRYTMEVEGDLRGAVDAVDQITEAKAENGSSPAMGPAKPAAAPKAPAKHPKLTWAEFRGYFGQWRNLKVLLGASLSWFLLDIAWYGLGLNQSIVIDAIGFGTHNQPPFKTLFNMASGNALVAIMGTVPGYFITVALVEKMGRKPIQLMGFLVLTVVFVVLCAAYWPLKRDYQWLFAIIYCFGQLFFNFGPNTTTFIIPGEVFPTRMRSTAHGICAASGKLGAIIAAYGFQPIVDHFDRKPHEKGNGVRIILGIFAVVMFLGTLATLMVPETKGRSLEEISGTGTSEKAKVSPATSPAVSPAVSPSVSPQVSPRLQATLLTHRQ